MNRFSSAWIAALAGVALVLSHPADLHAVTKKKKKPATEASDDNTTSSSASTPAPGTPAPRKASTPALDLPLPVKKDGGQKKDATPAPKKSTEGDGTSSAKTPAKTEKSADKTADKSTEKEGTETKAKTEHAPNATVEPDEISEFASQSPRIQQLIRDALDLTRLNLTYTFGSADPDNGGMDCSGTIYYLLHAHNFADVPRDSSGQYMWARRGAFFPVVSKSADSLEFKELLPGDLMFWTGTYESGRDIPISHVMMYLGREKGSGKRIMFGASDGRSYNGIQRWGVSVFDFKMPHSGNATMPEKTKVEFVGYARIPGLRGPALAPLIAEAETTVVPKKEASASPPASTPSKKTGTKSTKKKKKPTEE